ncbi:hypothetical protein GCM10028778_08470 [Barrientosiimonas marina]
MSINRLSSFLYQEGEVKPASLLQIQKHVYHLKTVSHEHFLLKRHSQKLRMEQQWAFFVRQSSSVVISFQMFPNKRRYLYDGHYYWTLSPFIAGRKLNYRTEADRKVALQTIRQFHKDTKGVKLSYPRRPEIFYERWSKRLYRFQTTEMIFHKYGYETLFYDIVRTAKMYLQLIRTLDWETGEIDALRTGTWSHGDVAAHNFLQYDNDVYLIDYDLLSCSSTLHDYVQLGQRFLPYLNWDIDRLLAYHMVDESRVRAWLYALCIPSDVMRDWLYYIQRYSSHTQNYLIKMDANWSKQRSFLKHVQNVLN